MLPVVGANQILEVVSARGLLESPRVIEVAGKQQVEGELLLPSGAVHTVRVPAFVPLTIPRVRLAPSPDRELLPHVIEDTGEICYLEAEGLVLDSSRPDDLVAEALGKAAVTLQVSTSEQRGAEFVDEFEVYWSNLPNLEFVTNVADPASEPGWRLLIAEKDKPTYLAIAADDVSAYYSGRVHVGHRTVRKVPYFPLAKGSVLIPPSRESGGWSASDARSALMRCVSPDQLRRIAKMLRKRPRQIEYCFFDLPRPSGGSSMFGIKFAGSGLIHPLLEGGTAESVRPVAVLRSDRSYLMPRGGASVSLSKRKVLVIGCGAIGGHIALELARAGVVRQTLVDPDSFAEENAFRHALGQRYTGENKAEALAKELGVQLPYVEAEAIGENVISALTSGKIELTHFDAVVAATGKPTIEMFIDEELHGIQGRPPAVYSWVEPLGIGGHAVLTGSVNGGGCLRCLFTAPTESLPDLHNRLAFAEQGKSYGRALNGCGTLHTPFGSLDSLRTAEMAVRLTIQALQGWAIENMAISWRGDGADFSREGHTTTPRYGMEPGKTEMAVTDFGSARCPICHAPPDG